MGLHLILSMIPIFFFLLGPQLTRVSVLQYGSITTIDVPWNVPQEKASLLSLVEPMQREGGPSQVGNVVPRGGMQELHLVLILGIRVWVTSASHFAPWSQFPFL